MLPSQPANAAEAAKAANAGVAAAKWTFNFLPKGNFSPSKTVRA